MYKTQVYKFMYNMKPGKKVELHKICKKEPVEKFIEAATEIIHEHWNLFGWKFTFNNDYTVLIRDESLEKQTFEQWLNHEE